MVASQRGIAVKGYPLTRIQGHASNTMERRQRSGTTMYSTVSGVSNDHHLDTGVVSATSQTWKVEEHTSVIHTGS